MGWNDRIDDDNFSEFLGALLESDMLDQPATGIVKLVMDKGEQVLTEKQKNVFQKYVIDIYVNKECKRGGCDIPWSEMYEAYDNGGYCSWCAKMMSNND